MTDKKVINILEKMAEALIENNKGIIKEDITVQYEAIKRGMEAIKAASTYRSKIEDLQAKNAELKDENINLNLEVEGLKKCYECKNRFNCYSDEEDMDRVTKCNDFIAE